MVRRMILGAAAAATMAGPCLAAELPRLQDEGARRSGGVAGAYFRIPLGGARSGRAESGLRLAAVHDYRTAGAPAARVVESEGFDLRLTGERKPTLFVAGRPVTGEAAEKSNLTGVGTVVTVVILVAAAVGGYYIVRAIDDSGEE